MEKQTKEITKRSLEIAYNVDRNTVQQIADNYGITFQECKATLRAAGLTVRKGEKPTNNESNYTIVLVDGENKTAVNTTKTSLVEETV